MNDVNTSARFLPGLALLVAGGAVAHVLGGLSTAVSALIAALVFGVLVANTVGVPAAARPGVDRHDRILEAGIVLLGAQLPLADLVSTGPTVVALAAAAVVFGVTFVELLARYGFGMGSGPRALLAAGASVCGVSAIVAVAGSVDVEEADVTYAVGTILLFDAVTLVAFPLVGTALGLTDRAFGVWAGLAMFSTGPTAAAGFAVSEVAGRWATVTKLVRNAFIGVLVIGYAVRTVRGAADPPSDDLERGTSPTSAVAKVWRQFPTFVLGFLAVVVIANLGLLSPSARSSLATAADWLFAVAFVGLGADLRLGRLRSAGVKPVLLVTIHLLTVGALALLAVRLAL